MAQAGEDAAGSVLVVDDDPAIRILCEHFLRRLGHRVHVAETVTEALRCVEREEIDVVVTDLRMPGGSGLDLIDRINSLEPRIRKILMSGKAVAADAALAMERGVDRLLLKPFDLEDLRGAVQVALAQRRAEANASSARAQIEALVRERAGESRLWVLRAAHALVAAVEAKDAYTGGHTSRVAAYGLVVAEVVQGIDLASFRLASELHDVGKIGVPDGVLNKPGRLTDEEFARIREHPMIGTRILAPLIDDDLVLGVVRWHHERWDGRGYPDRLAASDIPLPARVLAVADTLDAMTTSRAYRDRLPWEVAVAEVRACAGSQFDPLVVDAFEGVLPELEALYRSFQAPTV